MSFANENRPLQGQALKAVLADLARITAIASSLSHSLDPLEPEDIAAGAEPLTPEQIKADLEEIMQLVSSVVVSHLQVDTQDWLKATDAIE